MKIQASVAVGLLAFAFGCEPSEEPPTATVRDSAGVRVVQHESPTTSSRRIEVSPTPHVVIGTREGDPDFQLYRVSHALQDSQGRIIVANGPEILWFSAEGRLLAKAGGPGDGPSEFRGLFSISIMPGDSVMALNRPPASMRVFAPDGQFSTSFPMQHDPVQAAGLSAGVWAGLRFVGEDTPRTPALFSEKWDLMLYRDDFARAETLVTVAGATFFGSHEGSMRLPFPPKAVFAARRDKVAVASSADYDIKVFSLDGRLTMIIQNAVAPMAPPPSVIPNAVNRRQIITETGLVLVLDPPTIETMPVLEQLLIASNGDVWVGRYADPTAAVRTWDVYDGTSGHLTATATLSVRLQPTEVSDSTILGISMDELDVESVRLFRWSVVN